jgi:hypothetical protein
MRLRFLMPAALLIAAAGCDSTLTTQPADRVPAEQVIIDASTARAALVGAYDALQSLDEQWEQATQGKRTLQRAIIAHDRNEDDRYLILAFFDSYEAAMENSNLPETAEFAEKQMQLLTAPPVFYDLDVVDDRS